MGRDRNGATIIHSRLSIENFLALGAALKGMAGKSHSLKARQSNRSADLSATADVLAEARASGGGGVAGRPVATSGGHVQKIRSLGRWTARGHPR